MISLAHKMCDMGHVTRLTSSEQRKPFKMGPEQATTYRIYSKFVTLLVLCPLPLKHAIIAIVAEVEFE